MIEREIKRKNVIKKVVANSENEERQKREWKIITRGGSGWVGHRGSGKNWNIYQRENNTNNHKVNNNEETESNCKNYRVKGMDT